MKYQVSWQISEYSENPSWWFGDQLSLSKSIKNYWNDVLLVN